MSIILIPENRECADLSLNIWIWGTLMNELARSGVVSKHEYDALRGSLGGGHVDARKASAIAEHFGSVLRRCAPGDRLLLDGSVTSEPDSLELHQADPEDWRRNYSASFESIEQFISFCRHCRGFRVS